MQFDMIREGNRIGHCLTKPNHPGTNGQDAHVKRIINDATVKRYPPSATISFAGIQPTSSMSTNTTVA